MILIVKLSTNRKPFQYDDLGGDKVTLGSAEEDAGRVWERVARETCKGFPIVIYIYLNGKVAVKLLLLTFDI